MAKNYPELKGILKKLLYEQRLNVSELARETGLPTPTIHRMVNGKSTRPYLSSLRPIAEYFSITVEQLTGEVPLPEEKERNFIPSTHNKIISLPLIAWENLNQIGNKNKTKETVFVVQDLSSDCFATKMNDSSMEPHFSKGTILILDPTRKKHDRSFVLVKLAETGTFVFRQLLVDADYKFIKALNTDLENFQMRLLEDEDEIIASLVEARQTYDEF